MLPKAPPTPKHSPSFPLEIPQNLNLPGLRSPSNHGAAPTGVERTGMKIGITCYPTYGGSGVVATELGLELAHRGHEIHFISYAQPIRLTELHPNIHYHEVDVSRYPLFDFPPYDLALATRMAEVFRTLRPRHSACALCDPAFGERPAGPADARSQAARTTSAIRDHPARHRHHSGGTRPLLFADYTVFDRAERRRDRNLESICGSARCGSST